jgi:predicted O-methyltransferase YrrM
MSLLTLPVLVLVVLLAITSYHLYRYRRRYYAEIGRAEVGKVPSLPVHRFDPAFAHGPFGPTTAAEVHFIGHGGSVPGATSNTEAWILAVLARNARAMFEFGTAGGRTTYLWARNSPTDAKIFSITLAPDQHEGYSRGTGDSGSAVRAALAESRYTSFLYTGTPVESKITQLYGDSKALDETEHAGRFDLIFVDGSHAYSYVRSDSEKAFRMLAPGGIILWHDYKLSRGGADVVRYLDEISRERRLVRLAGTTLVAHRS